MLHHHSPCINLQAIQRQYHHNWIIDNLPAASILDTDQYVSTQYVGYPIGYVESPTSYVLYNHVNIIIEYHVVGEDANRIVGFYVEPLSIRHAYNGDWDGKGTPPTLTSCSSKKHLTYDDIKNTHQKVAPGKLVFSYGVEWRKSEVNEEESFCRCFHQHYYHFFALALHCLFPYVCEF